MKNFSVKRSNLAAAITAITLFSAGAAQAATTWNFNGSPTQGGWTYDTSTRAKKNDTRFPVKFVSSKVSTANGFLKVKSGALKDSNTVAVLGGGIKKSNAFSSNDSSARCRVTGSNAARKRSMASYWLHPNGANSHEVDMFELRPNAVNVTNFISWKNGKNVQAEGDSVIKWTGATNTWHTYRLVAANISGGRTKFTVTRDGANARSYNSIAGRTIGDEIVVHNKPWRFTSGGLTEGAVGTLVCDWVKKG